MFVENKYYKWYVNLIKSAVTRQLSGYTETHHITPRSMGGDNSSSNLVKLTAREHYIAHLLLPKIVESQEHKHKMQFALHRLIYGNKLITVKSSKLYETIKKELSEACSARSNDYWKNISPEQRSIMRSGVNNGRHGKPVSEETKTKISLANKGKQFRLGVKHTAETIELIKNKLKNQNHGKSWFHNNNTKQESFCINCPDGFSPGRLPGTVKSNYTALGKKWYNNPKTKEVKYFREGEQPDGFVLGRKIKWQ